MAVITALVVNDIHEICSDEMTVYILPAAFTYVVSGNDSMFRDSLEEHLAGLDDNDLTEVTSEKITRHWYDVWNKVIAKIQIPMKNVDVSILKDHYAFDVETSRTGDTMVEWRK